MSTNSASLDNAFRADTERTTPNVRRRLVARWERDEHGSVLHLQIRSWKAALRVLELLRELGLGG